MISGPDPDLVDYCAGVVRGCFSALGGKRIQTPDIQPMRPYLDFLGELYRARIIDYDQGNNGDGYCLRPDYTLALALELAREERPLGRYFYDDLVFRGDQDAMQGAAVSRQVGFEVFDEDQASLENEVALVSAAVQAVFDSKVESFKIVFGDVRLVCDLVDALPLHPQRKSALKRSYATKAVFQREVEAARLDAREPSALFTALSKASPDVCAAAVQEIIALADVTVIGGRTKEDIAARMIAKAEEADLGLTEKQARGLQQIADIEGPIDQALEDVHTVAASIGVDVTSRLERWRSLVERIAARGVDVTSARFDAGLGRGLSYYDGIVFEFHAGEDVFIGGGGRYDNLLARLSGGDIAAPALGAMLRPDRLAVFSHHA